MKAEIFQRERAGEDMLRKFVFLVGGIFCIIGLALLLRGRDHFTVFLVLDAALVLPAAVRPGLLRPVHYVWMTLAEMMGWVMTRVILTMLFFITITPISLVSRLFGTKYLDLDIKRSRSSYWHKRSKNEIQVSDYDRQF